MNQHTIGRAGAAWALVITSVAGFMAALDNLVVTTALPSIRESLGGEMEELEWTVNAYTLTFAVLLMFGAALGDRFGRRRLFLAGLTVFTGASAAAALSPGINELIAFRAVQGVGAAIMMPLTLTLLTAAVEPARRGMALGIFSAATGLAVASGPLIGGSLTEHISWQWIFWLNVPVGLLLLPLARFRLAESYAPGARLDIPGTLLVSGGLFGIVYGLVNANADGWTDPTVLTSLIAGTALIGAFIRHGFRGRKPMLPMRLFRDRGFFGINISSMLMYLGMFGSIFLLSQYLQGVLGYSPTEAGLRMLPWTGMPMLVAPIAGMLSDRFGGRPVVVTGLALQAAGLALFAMAIAPDASYVSQLPGLIVGGIGMALYFAPAASLVMSSVRPGEQGIASGANNALREVGGALGVAVLTTVFASQGGLESARSFTDGTVPAVWIGSGVVALAALVALMIPGRRATAKSEPAPEAAEAAERTEERVSVPA
ncbi:EmrB/QacA subfamily drug resistance transporter [Streptomyces sp. KhCrAH-43]|uniref:DHA2 family efflux MFS transporter permease subunit n=1 Tax=unclassified Streptomyces TaxID=2593676 RepID=UPI000374EFC5|nr:DHA2 family efflux MFS transporter permease subunit [Streptomyces sp. KhCrAH-43]MYS38573.1 DHA2 family efflux MFS transporter permease subunit [Streptomyces sp. SID4920]MYX66765.1 DHA2 family efflux MFS transporter permease subunit [Streptomyces sp. SID8373]RAJ68259.1 EmrB/QacA subfamily drug resistance transporter [Streptomyces sp. KhCrAH-43]